MAEELIAIISAAAAVPAGLHWIGRPFLEHYLSRRRERLERRDSALSEIGKCMRETLDALGPLAAPVQHPDEKEPLALAVAKISELKGRCHEHALDLPKPISERLKRFKCTAPALAAQFELHYGAPDWQDHREHIDREVEQLRAVHRSFEDDARRLRESYCARLWRRIWKR